MMATTTRRRSRRKPGDAGKAEQQPQPPVERTLLDGVIDLSGLGPDEAAQLSRALLGPVPTVELPSDDEMTIRLVPVPVMLQYDDLRGDYNLHLSIAMLLAGAFFGFVIALVMATSTVSAAAWTLGTCISVATATAALFAVRCARRLQPLRRKLFREPPQ
jgi:hypothetical protein